MQVLATEQHDHIITATVQRPEAKNAINFEVMDHLETLLDRIEEQEEIRCLIFTGGDGVFISGGDLKEFHGIQSAQEAEKMAVRMGTILKRLEKLPCWTIAAVNGAAYGGGWEMMLAFDFRIASPAASFHFTQSKFYLPPGWGGLTRLVEKVGRSKALQWLGEAADVDSESALAHGLIDQVVQGDTLIEQARAWGEAIAHNDRAFIDTLKQGAITYSRARWQAIERELTPFARFWEHEEHIARVEKFLERNQE